VYREHGVRVGWFHPNEVGERLLPMATGIPPAMRESREAGKNLLTDPDIASAIDHERALELALRKSNGKVIETEDIGIIDTHYLLAIADRASEDESFDAFDPDDRLMFAAEVDWLAPDESDEPWRHTEELPQYQIQVHLADHTAIP
jgi:hypothetical protein